MPSRRRGEIVEINVAEVGVQVEAGIDEGDADAPSVDALHREAERRGELRTGQVPITLTGWRACRDHRHVERNGLDVGVEVAAHRVLVLALGEDHGAFEDDLRVLVGVEEVRRTKVSVAARVAGVDPPHVGADLEAGALRVLGVDVDLAAQLAKPPADRADHHVLHGEGRLCVIGVDVPDHAVCLFSALLGAVS